MIGNGMSSARNSSGIDRLNINEISLRTDILSVDKDEKKMKTGLWDEEEGERSGISIGCIFQEARVVVTGIESA